jgi:hypothetical protein
VLLLGCELRGCWGAGACVCERRALRGAFGCARGSRGGRVGRKRRDPSCLQGWLDVLRRRAAKRRDLSPIRARLDVLHPCGAERRAGRRSGPELDVLHPTHPPRTAATPEPSPSMPQLTFTDARANSNARTQPAARRPRRARRAARRATAAPRERHRSPAPAPAAPPGADPAADRREQLGTGTPPRRPRTPPARSPWIGHADQRFATVSGTG